MRGLGNHQREGEGKRSAPRTQERWEQAQCLLALSGVGAGLDSLRAGGLQMEGSVRSEMGG